MHRTPLAGIELSRYIMSYRYALTSPPSAAQLLTYLKQHLELGISSCLHADIYGDHQTQEYFGQALKRQPALRNQIELIVQVGLCMPGNKGYDVAHSNTSAGHLVHRVEQSLTALATEQLELLLLHQAEPLLQADEVAHTLQQLHQQGKVNAFGVGHFSPSQMALLQSRLELPLVAQQLTLSPWQTEALTDGRLDYCQQHHLKPLLWAAPHDVGTSHPQTCRTQRLSAVLEKLAHEIGATHVDQVICAWLLALPQAPLLIRHDHRLETLQSAIKAQQLLLTREQWHRLWQAHSNANVPQP
ncbi:MAG: aldo/keto reductase [Ferrimonas sp.]